MPAEELRCPCAVCIARGNITVPTDRRQRRKRGFEIELASATIDQILKDPELCRSHKTDCGRGPKCSLLQTTGPKRPCACEICAEERGDKLLCPGHGCVGIGAAYPTIQQYMLSVVRTVIPAGKMKGAFNTYSHTPRDNDYWDLKTDSTCGYEIASPPMRGPDFTKVMGPMLRALNEQEALHNIPFVNERCGLHVTFDVSDLTIRDIRKVLLATIKHQAALLGTQPPARTGNVNCQYYRETKRLAVKEGNVVKELGRIMLPRRQAASMAKLEDLTAHEIGIGARRMLLNLHKFSNQRLIEFRFGGPTTNLGQMEAFSVMLECLIEAALTAPFVTPADAKPDRKKRFYEEIIKPFTSDERVARAWENVLQPALKDAKLLTV